MPVNIDVAAITVMELFGVASYLVAFLFFKQKQRMNNKRRELSDAFKKGLISERGDGKCFSSEWVLSHIVYKPRKMLNATPYLALAVFFLTALLYFEIGTRAFPTLLSFGYVIVVALAGFAVITETDAFEAYGYSKAVYKVPIEQFDKEDQSYVETAQSALKLATVRFFMLGIFFAAVGPFIPQIFSGVLSTVLSYTSIVFYATGASSEFSQGLAVILAVILPGLIIFVPLVFGKAIFLKVKELAQKMLNRPKGR